MFSEVPLKKDGFLHLKPNLLYKIVYNVVVAKAFNTIKNYFLNSFFKVN